jgi:Na+:H+ antiporter, NhaA family
MHKLRKSTLREFLTNEAAGGIILIITAIAALIIANSALAPIYFQGLDIKIAGLSILHWINDGLMAIFFLLVGLEIKRELVEGQLATWHLRALPCIAAIGGMIVPALIYIAFNKNTPTTLNGWAVPVATDIAFALGVMALAGKRVPASLKVFLTALAIIDDLGAVIIIAVFYTSNLSALYLAGAGAILALLITLNRMKTQHLMPYLGLGCLLWFFTLKSGIHPSIAGVAFALTIPIENLSEKLEHSLQPYVAFLIIPIFGFANSGLSLSGVQPSALLNSVPLGIALGLFFGKQIGVFGFSYAAIKLKIAHRPTHSSWMQFYGVALLCGIGFTMSLFIGNLAFASPALQEATKLGVLAGSILSAILGWLVLKLSYKTT